MREARMTNGTIQALRSYVDTARYRLDEDLYGEIDRIFGNIFLIHLDTMIEEQRLN